MRRTVFAHDHGRLQHFGELAQLALGAEHAAADEDRRVVSAAEQSGGMRQGVWVRLWWWGSERLPSSRRPSGCDIGRNFNHHRTAAAAVQLAKSRLHDVRGASAGDFTRPCHFETEASKPV